jgi:hypothetical protein
MKKSTVSLAISLALLACSFFQTPAQAAKGTPDSPDFGYGAQIHLEGKYSGEALHSAAQIKLDWVQIEFDWAARWPTAVGSPSLQDLDAAMQTAGENHLAVLLSLTDAPAWASSPRGPDPALTAQLLTALARRYADSLKGIELFPAANTVLGWGALPNPQAYLTLFQNTTDALHANGLDLTLVAAGLTPLGPVPMPQDMDDLAFLSGLYAAGGAEQISILSLRFDELTGDPLQSPSQNAHPVLRHYEAVRQVMLANHHSLGILWITRFGCPSGTIQAADSLYRQPAIQSAWLSQAYRQLRAQLYIGAAFVANFNSGIDGDSSSLIAADGSSHPFMILLGRLIAQNNQSLEAASQPNSPILKFLLNLTS